MNAQAPMDGAGTHPLFDAAWYMQQNPDVAAAGVDPLQHYMTHGWREGRDPHPLFDTSWYLEENSDVAEAGENPLVHYCLFGWREGRDPHSEFDTSFYLEQYRDVAAANVNPLVHYVTNGKEEGRQPKWATKRLLATPRAPSADDWIKIQKNTHDRLSRARIDVIIPVYKGYDDTLACIYSVLQSTPTTPFELIVINDASPDARLRTELSALSRRGLFSYFENQYNLGFVLTANRGLRMHENRDVVLLNSDTIVFSDWLDRIIALAASDTSIATITPLSNNATICSYPETLKNNNFELELQPEQIDSIARSCNKGQAVDAPTGVGFCFYIRRETINRIGVFDNVTFGKGYGEENDFCRRAAKAGYRNVLALDTYVLHTGEVSFSETGAPRRTAAQDALLQKHPEYEREIADYIACDPSRLARARIDLYRLAALYRNRCVMLVSHTWGGGIERHTKDLEKRLQDVGVPTLWLRVGTKGSSTASIHCSRTPEFMHIPNLTGLNLETDTEFFAEVLRTIQPLLIHVHSVVGLNVRATYNFFEAIRDSKFTYIYTWHDASPLCCRNDFVTSERRYCGGPHHSSCETCFSNSSRHKSSNVHEWRNLFRRFFDGAKSIIAPSQSAARDASLLAPPTKVKVVPHSEHYSKEYWISEMLDVVAPLRIAIVGAIGAQKGADVIFKLVADAEMRGLSIRYAVIGHTDRNDIHEGSHFEVSGRYQTEDDALKMLKEFRPHLFLFPSIGPETHGYSLSLGIAVGIPPVVFNLGAQAERIREMGWGRILSVELIEDATKLNDTFLALPLEAMWNERKAPSWPECCDLKDYYGSTFPDQH